MATIHHQLAIESPIERVYAALSSAEGVSTWWDKQTPVQTEQGLVLEHSPGPKHGVVRLRVLDLVQNRRVEWECISDHPLESPASVWTGTHFIFEISEHESPASVVVRDCMVTDDRSKSITTLDFYQTNYDEGSAYAGFNNFAWGQVLRKL